MSKNYRHIMIRYSKIIISVIIIFYIIRFISSSAGELNNFEFKLNYLYLITSTFLMLIYIFNQFLLWHYITIQNHCNISFSNSITSRAYSEFGKYVPGKVFGYAMLFYVYSKENMSKVHVAFCMFIELLSSVLSASLIFLVSMFFTGIPEFQKYRFIVSVFLISFFVLINPQILNYISNIFLKIFRKEPVQLHVSYFQLLKTIGLYVLNFMIFGVAFMFFINAILPMSFSNYLFITGTTAGAGLIGLFAIFVPAGLGVREGVMVFALSFIITPALAGIIALSTRIWMVLSEVFLFGLIFIFSKIKLKENVIKDI